MQKRKLHSPLSFLFIIPLFLILAVWQTAHGATETNSTVTAERGDSAKVKSESSESTASAAGDKSTPGKNPVWVLVTSKGTISIELNSEKAPKTVQNIIDYTESGFYNGTVFHRVIKNFMIQGGGFATGMKKKDTQAPVANEADNGLKNMRGTVAMARTQDPHSATSQFFINTKNNKNLDHTGKNKRGWGYCVFGKVISGMDVVDAMESVTTSKAGRYRDVPSTPIIIQEASIQ